MAHCSGWNSELYNWRKEPIHSLFSWLSTHCYKILYSWLLWHDVQYPWTISPNKPFLFQVAFITAFFYTNKKGMKSPCMILILYVCVTKVIINLGIIIHNNSPSMIGARLKDTGAFSFIMLRILLNTIFMTLTSTIIIVILLIYTYNCSGAGEE